MGPDPDEATQVDALTGLKNRRHFTEVLYDEVVRAHRDRRRLALLLLDLDKFKRVNDQLGHVNGDIVLKKFADRMREVAREADVTCRFGGEEFAVLLTESSFDDATQFASRLNDRLAAEPVLELWDVTVTSGIAELKDGENADALLMRADQDLYEKRHGPPPTGPSGVREPRRPKPSSGSPGTWKLLS